MHHYNNTQGARREHIREHTCSKRALCFQECMSEEGISSKWYDRGCMGTRHNAQNTRTNITDDHYVIGHHSEQNGVLNTTHTTMDWNNACTTLARNNHARLSTTWFSMLRWKLQNRTKISTSTYVENMHSSGKQAWSLHKRIPKKGVSELVEC